MTKLPNDTFLITYPHHLAMQDYSICTILTHFTRNTQVLNSV